MNKVGEMMKKEKISIVVPCYNEEETINSFYEEIMKVKPKMKNNTFELIFIDDGSSDKTLSLIKELIKKDKSIRYISFSRNFGKEAAILAGLKYSTGEYVTIMDCDLQDPPIMLPTMYKYIKEENYDCVGVRRVNRQGEPLLRTLLTKLFYKLINMMSKVEMVEGARDYRLMHRKVVEAIISMTEYNRYSKGMFSFVGFKTKWLEYENVKRIAGKTKWSLTKLIKYAWEAITSFSDVPLLLSAIIGIIMCLISFIFISIIIFKTICFDDPVAGWPSLACIIIFFSGIQLFFIGVIGQYLSKIYLETKRRPIYIVKETERDK